MDFLKKVCFLRRFSVVFLRCLGGDEVEIWKDWGSGGPFSGVLSKNMAENVVGAMVAVLSKDRPRIFWGCFSA